MSLVNTNSNEVNTLWAKLKTTEQLYPQNIALIHANQEISYGALTSSVHRVAKALHCLELQPGDRIALVAVKSVETVTLILAALHLRIVLVLINPLLKGPQLNHILDDSGAVLLVCELKALRQLTAEYELPSTLQNVILLPASQGAKSTCQADESESMIVQKWHDFILLTSQEAIKHPCGEDLALILYTSGSTGKPKGVMLSHSNILFGALSVSTYLKNNQNDRILALMPLSFDYGFSQLTSSIVSGATIVLYDYILPRALIRTVIKHQITGIPAVPHVWDQLVKIDWPEDICFLRYITNTGGKLLTPTIRKLMQKLPNTAIYSMYGFTEAFRASYLNPKELAERPTSVGKAVPFATVLVVDESGKEQPPFEHGELIQAGSLVSQGYWNDPAGTASKIRPRAVACDPVQLYAWSGDIAYKDAEGYIYFVSRKDDIVKLNGHRSSPSEIESTLARCPSISQASVLCIPDDRFGNVVVAFVVLAYPTEPKELTRWCQKTLPPFMVPAQWQFLDEFPLTPNKKIDKAMLGQYLTTHQVT